MFELMIISFIYPLLLTLVIEMPIYFSFRRDSLVYFFVMTGLNILLNLNMNFIIYACALTADFYNLLLIGLEIAVFSIEAGVAFSFRGLRWRGIVASFAANGASLSVGLLLNCSISDSDHFLIIALILAIFFILLYPILMYLEYKNTLRKMH